MIDVVKASLETNMDIKLVFSTALIFVVEPHIVGLHDDNIETASHREKKVVHTIKEVAIPNDVLSKGLQRRQTIVRCELWHQLRVGRQKGVVHGVEPGKDVELSFGEGLRVGTKVQHGDIKVGGEVFLT